MIPRRQSLLETMVIGAFGGVLLICGSHAPTNAGLLALGVSFGSVLGWLGYLRMAPASRASFWAGLGIVFGCKSHPVVATEAEATVEESGIEVLSLPNERPCPSSFSKEGCAEFLGGSGEIGPPLRRDQILDARRVVAGMKPGFRACFNEGRRHDPNLAGSLTVVAKVGAEGQVISATTTTDAGLSKDVLDCVVRRVEAAQFAAPTKGSAQIRIPIKFVPD